MAYNNPPIFTPTAATGAAIAAAGLAAYNAGGGIVQLQPITYTVTAPIPLYSGVVYQGAGYGFTQTSNSAAVTGTVLSGNTGIDCFAFNVTDQVSAPTNYTTFMSQFLQGAGVKGMTLSGFNHGIKCGALWNAGCQFSEFKDIYAQNCNWGFWFENWIECNFEGLYCNNSGVGNGWFFNSGGSALNGGNSTFRKLFYQDEGNGAVRGWVFGSRGTGTTSSLNAVSVLNIQGNRARVLITQAATMANSSANITVTNGSAFVVDMPVGVSSSVNGFATNQTYFVTSIVGNVITLSNTVGGSNISATGNSAVNIITYGFAQLEIIGYGNNTVQPCDFIDCDLEGGGCARIIMQNCQDVRAKLTFTEYNNLTTAEFVARNCTHCEVTGTQSSGTGLTYELDSNSGSTRIFGPRNNGTGVSQQQQAGLGVSTFAGSDTRAQTNSGMVFLSGYYGSDIQFNKNLNFVDFSSNGIGFRSNTFASGGTIYNSRGSLQIYSGSSTGTATLPLIPTNGDGLFIEVSNPSSGTLTVSSSGSQNIVGFGASATSYAIPTLTNVIFTACANGATLYWSVK